MRAFGMHQPWASLVAVGAKKIETRSKPAPSTILGQRVAIHACLTKQGLVRVSEPLVGGALFTAHGAGTLAEVDGVLPLGHLLATAVVARSERMTNESVAAIYRDDPAEHAFGFWFPGRYAWHLEDVQRLPEPVPFKGKQGIFFVPDELLGLEPEPVQESLL